MNYLDFGKYDIPDYMQDGLRRYIEKGVPPGHFLTAVLSNNLRETFARADDVNRHRVWNYLKYLYNGAPAGCWGTPDKVNQWIKVGGLNGREGDE